MDIPGLIDIPTLEYYRTHENVVHPRLSTQGAACYDLCSHLVTQEDGVNAPEKRLVTLFTPTNREVEILPQCSGDGKWSVMIPPHFRAIIPTGVIFKIPRGHSVRLHSRSGLSIKKGFIVANCEGVIDEDYFHEIKSLMVNNSDVPIEVFHKDRIVQAEIVQTLDHVIQETDIKPSQTTDRTGGLGSTGVSTQESQNA